jgi:hypothetical protein
VRRDLSFFCRARVKNRKKVRLLFLIPLAAMVAVTGMGTAWASTPLSSVSRTKRAAGYTLRLQIGPPMKMSMNGMGGEMTMGGKKARCSMSQGMQMISGRSSMGMAKCNHHVELHVYKNGKVVHGAHVQIRMYCIKMHMNVWVPIMAMMMPKHPHDFHYANNVHAPEGVYTVFVTVNGVHARFNKVYIGQ